MDPNALVNLALVALNAVLGVIAQIKSQGGLTDDQIAANVQTLTQGNDTAYTSIMAALNIPTTPAK